MPFLGLGTAAAEGTKPLMAILPTAGSEDSPGLGAACNAATRDLCQAVGDSGLYEEYPVEQSPANSFEAYRAWATANDIDFIVQGAIARASAGKFDCSIALFDRAKGTQLVQKCEKCVDSLDILETFDALIARTFSAASGRHLAFGTLTLRNTGAEGRYAVFLDGEKAGDDLTRLSAVLAGTHHISIRQSRPLGELELAAQNIDLAENGSASIDFSIPELTPEEQSRLEGLEADIDALIGDPGKTAQVEVDVADYLGLTSQPGCGVGMAAYADRARLRQAEWSIRKNHYYIEANAWSPSASLLDPGIEVYLKNRDRPEGEDLRNKLAENASLLATFLELAAGSAFARGDYADAEGYYRDILSISGYLPPERTCEFAYGATTLSSILDESSPSTLVRNLATVFGSTMRAGEAFYKLKEGYDAEPDTVVVIPTNLSSKVMAEDGSYSSGPFALASGLVGEKMVVMDDEKRHTTKSADLDRANDRFAILDTGLNYYARQGLPAAKPEAAKRSNPSLRKSIGTISFPWLPSDCRAIWLSGQNTNLFPSFDGTLMTNYLLPGTYDLSVSIADKGYNLKGKVRAGADTGAPLPSKSYLGAAYKAEQAQLKGKRARGYSIGIGLIGAGGLLIGNTWGMETGNTPGGINFGLVAGAAAAGFGAIIVLTTPSQKQIDESLARLDEQIAKYAR